MSGLVSSNRAVKRLQQDLRDLQVSPIPNVHAQPLESNILEWRVNMVAAQGQLQRVPVHIHMTFPPTYPEAPPEVILITVISHPFIIGNKICVDMLNFSGYHGHVETTPYTGWSAAYTVSSILLQLYGLLLVDETVSYGFGHHRVRRAEPSGDLAKTCHATLKACSCGVHQLPKVVDPVPSDPWHGPPAHEPPPSTLADFIPTKVTARINGAGASSPAAPTDSPPAAVDACNGTGAVDAVPSGIPALAGLEQLDDNVARLLLSKLAAQDLLRCCAAGNARLARLASDALQRSELLCFFSRRPHDEVVLGYGVQVARRHGGGRRPPSGRPAPDAGAAAAAGIQSLSTKTDFLSLEAFESGVRHSAWNMSFDAFLPLYLNPAHGKRALAVLPRCVRAILSSAPGPAGAAAGGGAVPPAELLVVMGLLMNSLVVEVVAGGSATAGVSRHMSDAALQGFCHLHHLLLSVALEPGSGLMQRAQDDVVTFMEDPAARHKNHCPDLGRLLVSYLLVPEEVAPWSVFAPAFLRELLARQVRWAMAKAPPSFGQPQLERRTAGADSQPEFERLKTHFEGSVVGIRNVLLQAWFANALARPLTAAGSLSQLRAIKAAYDELSGRPAPRVFAAFNRHAREVMACGSWTDLLGGLRLGISTASGATPRAMFVAVLSQAVLDSYDAGYHRTPNPYAGASAETVHAHFLRRKVEAKQLRRERAEKQAACAARLSNGGDAAPAAAATSSAVDPSVPEATEPVGDGQGGWKEVLGRKPAAPRPVARRACTPAVKRDPDAALSAMERERPRLCFVSWELQPVGVVSSKWM